jgi:GTP cyclohydrolase I
LYASLDDPNVKGLNLSRFPILMHELINPSTMKKHAPTEGKQFSIQVIDDLLHSIAKKQNAKDAYCKFRFSYPWMQSALRTRKELPDDCTDHEVFKVAEGKKLSHDKAEGYIFYNCELEGQLHDGKLRFYLTVDYIYSSTCCCSFELAYTARKLRNKAANAHSQRSIAKIKVQFNPQTPTYIEDIVEMAREYVPTEVQVIVKRRDEMAQAERNGSSLIFTECASRLFYEGLDNMFNEGKIQDFSVVTDHLESLHNFQATAVIYKGIAGGLH